MENRKDYEKRLGERLEAAYMQEDIGPVMSREEFHRLIQTAEKKKKHRRTMLSLAAACVALCLVCGGFVAGMTMRESASAGKGDETKTVQQGSSVVIGSGVSEKDQNVGVSTKTYTNIEDIPEDIRKEIHFLDIDEFELEKVKVTVGEKIVCSLYYCTSEGGFFRFFQEQGEIGKKETIVLADEITNYQGNEIYIKECDGGKTFSWISGKTFYSVYTMSTDIKIEAIVDDLQSV